MRVVLTAEVMGKRLQISSRHAANEAEAELAKKQLRELATMRKEVSPKVEIIEDGVV